MIRSRGCYCQSGQRGGRRPGYPIAAPETAHMAPQAPCTLAGAHRAPACPRATAARKRENRAPTGTMTQRGIVVPERDRLTRREHRSVEARSIARPGCNRGANRATTRNHRGFTGKVLGFPQVWAIFTGEDSPLPGMRIASRENLHPTTFRLSTMLARTLHNGQGFDALQHETRTLCATVRPNGTLDVPRKWPQFGHFGPVARRLAGMARPEQIPVCLFTPAVKPVPGQPGTQKTPR